MSRGIRLMLGVALVVVFGGLSVVASSTGAHALKPTHSLTIDLKLPGPGSERVVLMTVKVSNARATVRSLRITNPTEAKLPSGIRAMYAERTPTRGKHGATFKIYFAINNLGTTAASVAHASQSDDFRIGVDIFDKYGILEGEDLTPYLIANDCDSLVKIADGIEQTNEAHAKDPVASPTYYEYDKAANETSNPEEVFDHVVHNACKAYGAELPEPGPE